MDATHQFYPLQPVASLLRVRPSRQQREPSLASCERYDYASPVFCGASTAQHSVDEAHGGDQVAEEEPAQANCRAPADIQEISARQRQAMGLLATDPPRQTGSLSFAARFLQRLRDTPGYSLPADRPLVPEEGVPPPPGLWITQQPPARSVP